jgi:hypothetical protein
VPTLVDLDFDEDLDMLCGNLWGEVSYYENQNGIWVENSFIMDGIETDQNTTPAFADLDDDGDPDLILGQYNGTFSYYENRNIITSIPHEVSYQSKYPASVYPNPVISEATVKYHLQATSNVSIHIMESTGASVFRQQFENLSPGDHSFQWDATSLKPGMYFIRITGTDRQEILKVLKVK